MSELDIEKFIFLPEYQEIRAALSSVNSPQYLSIKDLRFKNWHPQIFGYDQEKFWDLVKFNRKFTARQTPIRAANHKFFTWQKLDHFDKLFYKIDRNKTSCEEGLKQGFIEEAIASSQLEGCDAARKSAKIMLEEKRDPRTDDEKMIFGNFLALQKISENYKNDKLSLDILLDLQMTLTGHEVFLGKTCGENEMQQLIAFANDELDEEFIHPLIKAIILHFWIMRLRPFDTSVGRLARCLFYWYLLRRNYNILAILPISVAIKNSVKQYDEAYALAIQDDNDLTYFIDYNLKTISETVDNFAKYNHKKTKENEVKENILNKYRDLNHRQIEILFDLYKHPKKSLNMTNHMKINDVTKVTALKDLKELVEFNFVTTQKQGKNVFYLPTAKVFEVFSQQS